MGKQICWGDMIVIFTVEEIEHWMDEPRGNRRLITPCEVCYSRRLEPKNTKIRDKPLADSGSWYFKRRLLLGLPRNKPTRQHILSDIRHRNFVGNILVTLIAARFLFGVNGPAADGPRRAFGGPETLPALVGSHLLLDLMWELNQLVFTMSRDLHLFEFICRNLRTLPEIRAVDLLAGDPDGWLSGQAQVTFKHVASALVVGQFIFCFTNGQYTAQWSGAGLGSEGCTAIGMKDTGASSASREHKVTGILQVTSLITNNTIC